MKKELQIHFLPILIALSFSLLIFLSCSDDTTDPPGVPSGTTVMPNDQLNQEIEEPEDSTLVRTTTYGKIKGKETNNNTYAWLGIPYAKPPIDDLRWRAPQDPDPWEGTRPSEEFCSYCTQYGNYISETGEGSFGKASGDEDCLYLNIWRPNTDEKQLPVFIFIHGGANFVGRGDLSIYDGANFAAKSNMIFVTLNYRLGVLGWFSHPELRTGDPLDDSGNYGTLDIIKALEWLQGNIQAFGGNPDNITISGQSAGAFNVYSMLASPLAKGLFHKAIPMSGFPMSCTVNFAERKSEKIVTRLLTQDGFTLDDGKIFDSSQNLVFDSIEKYLKSRTIEDLFNPEYAAASGLPNDGGLLSTLLRMGITADGVVIPKDILKCLKAEEYNKVPLLIGNTSEEFKLFLPLLLVGDDALFELVENFDPNNPEFSLPDFLNPILWPILPLYEPISLLGQLVFQGFGVDNTAKILSAFQDVYVYQFDWKDEPEPFDFFMGAGHALDLPFAFGNFIPDHGSLTRFAWSDANKEGREAVSHAMMTYYAEFARSGNPNSDNDDLMDWLPWNNDSGADKRMVFNAEDMYTSKEFIETQDIPDLSSMLEAFVGIIGL